MEQGLKRQVRKTLGKEDFEMWLLEQGMEDAKALYLIWRRGKCGRTAFEFEFQCAGCKAGRSVN
jgi:hypothetical protein